MKSHNKNLEVIIGDDSSSSVSEEDERQALYQIKIHRRVSRIANRSSERNRDALNIDLDNLK